MKSWLQDNNNIEIYSTNNEGKAAVAERFVRTLNLQIHDFNIKNVFIDKLDNIMNKYNNTYYNTYKIKPAGNDNNTCIDFGKKRYW